jgi:hypothetical protein
MDFPNTARPDAILQSRAEKDQDFADEMWRLRHPEKDGQKLTLVEVMVELEKKHGVSIKSVSSVSTFYKWLAVRRDFQQSRNVIHQIKEQMRQDPEFTEEAIERAGVVMMATRGIQTKDGRLFSAMMKIGQGRVKLKQNDQKIAISKEVVEMDKRKLVILERKAAKADAAEEVSNNGTMSAEEKQARMKEIFGS